MKTESGSESSLSRYPNFLINKSIEIKLCSVVEPVLTSGSSGFQILSVLY